LYPNPSSGLINIISADNSIILDVVVLDLRGNIVYKLSSEGISEIDLSHLPKGTYFIQVKNEKNQEIKKIILI
jgi:hypothetical protein